MRRADERLGPWSPFAMRPMILILASAVAVGLCVLALVRYDRTGETCGCSGNPDAVCLAQRVVAKAGGVEAWKTMRAFAWRAPDGSRVVYAQYLQGNPVESLQVARGAAHLQRQGGEWSAYHYDVQEWPATGEVREQLGRELMPVLDRDFVIATLPFRLCDEQVHVDLVAESEAASTVRVTGPRFVAAGLDGCEISISKKDGTITTLSYPAPQATVIRFARWESIGAVVFPVVEGLDDEEHRVEVFDHEFKAPFILGRH